ncbi:MAG TPA: NAD-dependent epimerase/dehydratase family protein [Polyangiales bacterium]|jgi:UDP-glucose 4-epimerase|nr:NAD-dependent epimerase/dehydratase family protein [Polyangiales bacterium]
MSSEKGAGAAGLASQAEGKLPTRTAKGRRVIAITGAMTFLGRSLVRLLAEADDVARVVVVDLENPDTAGPATTFYAVDLTQPGADARLAEILQAERIDTLVHLAFLEAPTAAVGWAHELESVGTMHVLRACHKQMVSKLIVGSSSLVYGPHADNPNYLGEERPLRGLHDTPFVSDKIDVEQQVARFRQTHPDCTVTVLRLAALLGPSVRNFVVRWFSRTFVPTVLGYDPLLQFVHEVDALSALRLAIERDVPGTFNIASSGVLPLSTVIRLSGGLSFPLPYAALRRVSTLLWSFHLSEAPPAFVALLRHLCVVDTTRARQYLGFQPDFSTRDAVLDFEAARRARAARVLSATP